MKLKILHLSDLHITSNKISQDIVLTSLTAQIENICKTEDKPNLIIITGDIAFSGKSTEYVIAKEFIDKIAQICGVGIDRIFIIPGNHDVDRSKLESKFFKWWYNFTSELELTDVLSSPDALGKIQAGTHAYYEFLKQFMSGKTSIGEYGEYVSTVPITDGLNVKILGLNSAIFCGYDGDDQKKLALGLVQINECQKKIEPDDIIIACVHHPFECFNDCDKASINTLQRISDLVLSGHVHHPQNTAQSSGNSGETIFITSGAAYEKRNFQNGFNIIELDNQTLKGSVIFFKYLHDEHLWIRNKDINHKTDGIFGFDLQPRQGNINITEDHGKQQASSENSTYMVVLDGKFDELDRDRFEALEAHLKTICKDLNVTIKKLEKSSIKIYFETSSEIDDEIKSRLTQIDGFEILEIKKTDHNSNNISQKPDKSVYHWKTFLKPEYYQQIENPGATFTHSRADNLTLKDLFVSPNLKILSIGENAKEKVDRIINAEKALKKSNENLRVVIYGTESSGKTTLSRWWYERYYELGYIPILITGNEIKDISVNGVKKLIQREFSKQYNGIFEGEISDYDEDRIIVIIDDFHKTRFTHSKFKANLILNLDKAFRNIFLTGNDLMQFETYTSKTGIVQNILDSFHRFQIIEFGPTLRYELIRKWNGLGSEQLEPNELIRLNNETEKHVESIIGKSFVPSFPVYLLTILQAQEAITTQKPEFSIHGFYYELLINDALNKAVKNKADISLYYNYITEYSYFLFNEKIRLEPLYIDAFLIFHEKYCIDYKIDISPKLILDTLENSKLLVINNGTISISYKYVYYFFVARYLANNISEKEIKLKVKLLCQRIHRDEFASIVMFLTHLSKDQFILNELLENSKALFKEFEPLKLEDDVSFVNQMIKNLPEQVYLPIDVETIKQEELREEEELSEQEKHFDSSSDVYDYDINEDISSLDFLSTLIKSIKTIEILGQVTKKYWGELKAPQKFELAEETYMLGLRTLGFYYSLIGNDTEMLVEYLKHIYIRKNSKRSITKEDIDKASRNFLFNLCAMSTFGIIKSITNSIGYEKLSGTFEDILDRHNYNSIRLIDTSIKLDHNKSFPWKEIEDLKKQTDKNYLAEIVLRNLVVNYLYIFITSDADKQKICKLIGIKMDQQRMIDVISKVKRETPSK